MFKVMDTKGYPVTYLVSRENAKAMGLKFNWPQPEKVEEPNDKPTKTAKDVLGIDGAEDDFNELGNILGLKQEPLPYDNISELTRPDAKDDPNPKRIELAKTALDRLLDRYSGTVVGQSLIANFVRGKAALLKGQTVTSLEDVAAIAQPLRDPRYEVFTWIFTKGDTVVHAQPFSARLPSSTDIFDTDSLADVKKYLEEAAKEYGADGFWMLHNHPGGSPQPSIADTSTTYSIHEMNGGMDIGFLGHVIINSNQYGFIDVDGKTGVVDKEFHKQDPTLLSPEEIESQKYGYLIGIKIGSPEAIADAAKAVERSDQATLVAINHKNAINAVAYMPMNVIVDAFAKRQAKRMGAWLSKFAKLSGGGRVYLVVSGDQAEQIKGDYAVESVRHSLKFNLFEDILVDGQSLRKSAGVGKHHYWQLGRVDADNRTKRVQTDVPPFLDQSKYEQAKPIMDRLFTKYEQTGKTLPEFVQALLSAFKPEAKPYIIQFLKDKRDEPTHNKEEGTNANNQTGSSELGEDQPVEAGTDGPIELPGIRGDGGSSSPVSGDGVVTPGTVGGNELSGTEPMEQPGGSGRSGSQRTAKNYRIGDDDGIGEASPAQKKKDLVAALEVINKLEKSGKPPTKADQDIVAKFPGWGWTGDMLSMMKKPDGTEKSSDPEFRDKVRELLTPEEFESASIATLNSHYTSIPIIDAHWKLTARLGFKGGKAIEPSAGAGHFLGRSPKGVDWTTVELDSLSAKIVNVLYPEAKNFHAGFEQISAKGDKSLVISNVPFGQISIADYAFEKAAGKLGKGLVKSIHNYFISKGLDHLHDGGIEIVTTSAFSMDGRAQSSRDFREYMLDHADFIGGIRLPETAFQKVAGTSVTTDILVFRKRGPNDPIAGNAFLDVVETVTPDGDVAYVNEYFLNNPQMVLGTHSMRGKMQAGASYTVKPDTSTPLIDQLNKAISKFPKDILNGAPVKNNLGYDTTGVRPPDDVRVWNLFSQDGEYYLKTSKFESEPLIYLKKALNSDQKKQVQAYLDVRNAVKTLIDLNRSTNDDKLLEPAQKNLRKVYDAYVKKYGKFGESKNQPLLKKDAEWAMVFGLEQYRKIVTGYDKNDKEITKDEYTGLSKIFDKRVASFGGQIDKAEDATSALIASLENTGRVSLPEMERVSGIKPAQLLKDLEGQLYFDPAKNDYVLRDEYGSGNVKKKLAEAKSQAEINPEFEKNVEFLESVQPEPMQTRSIKVNLGTKWIPENYISEFFTDIAGRDINVKYNSALRVWNIDGSFPSELNVVWVDKNNSSIQHTYSYTDVAKAALANASVQAKVPDGHDDQGRPIMKPHKELTELANSAVEQLRAQWDSFWRSDEELAKHLTDMFNDIVNVIQRRVYDGSFLNLPGIATHTLNGDPFAMRRHQLDEIWRSMVQDFSLAAHGVGAGKTWEIIGTAKELRRTGKRQKVVIVAKNETETQIFDAINQLYPGSSILFVEPKDMTKENRQQLMGRIATGEYDFIIMRHSDFKLIPVSDSVYTEALRRAMTEIYEMAAGIGFDLSEYNPYNEDDTGPNKFELMKLEGDDKLTVKQLWRNLKNLATRHQRRNQKLAARQDTGLYFDDLGIDHLLIDEFHYYRNIAYQSVRGGLGSAGSEMGEDMRMKLDFIRSLGGGATGYTGTPIVNTIAELYAQFVYFDPQLLADQDTKTFDEWVNSFGETKTTFEQDVSGAFKPKTRTSKYINQAQLVNNFWNIADVKLTADLPEIKRPDMVDEDGNVTGKPIVIESHPSDIDNSFNASLQVRAQIIQKRKDRVKKGDDIMLSIANDANDGAIDILLVDPTQPDDPNSKVNKAVAKMIEIYNLPKVKELKGTQLVFLDRGAPKKTTPAPSSLYFTDVSFDDLGEKSKEIEKLGYTPISYENENGTYNVEPDLTPEFNLYENIKQKLVAAGIPANEIAFAQNYNTRVEKQSLYNQMNSGKIRIMLTSTLKGGVGVNVQERLFALHNMDCPWTPADYEQRLGRIVRQGNIWKDHGGVRVYNHIKVGSFDSFRWNVLARKIVPITQMMKGDVSKSEVDVEDMDEVEFYEQQAAQAAGRTDILDYVRLGRELDRMNTEKRGFEMRQNRAKRQLRELEDEIPTLERKIKALDNEGESFLKLYPEPFAYTKPRSATIIDKPKEAGLEIINQLQIAAEKLYPQQSQNYVELGNVGGIKIYGNIKNTVQKSTDPYHFVGGVFMRDDKYNTIYITKEDRDLTDYFSKPENFAAILVASMKREIQGKIKKAEDIRSQIRAIEKRIDAIKRKSEEKWPLQNEYDEILSRWAPLEKTVGQELKSDEGAGGWGTKLENDPMPKDYWLKLRADKVARRMAGEEAADKKKKEAQKVEETPSTDNFFANPFKKKAPTGGGSTTPTAPKTNATWDATDWMQRPQILDSLLRLIDPTQRGPLAAETALYLRKLGGVRTKATEQAAHMMEDAQKYFDKMPRKEALEFIDNLENGEPQKNPELQKFADIMRILMDDKADQVRGLGTGKLETVIENYFPHIWKKPEEYQSWVKQWIKDNLGIEPGGRPGLGRKPVEGSKAFLKHRSIPTIADGMKPVADGGPGLEPVSYNPVDLILMKLREMDKYILAVNLMDKLKAEGMLKYVQLGQKVPEGYEIIKSPFFDVHSPGEITVEMLYDDKMLNDLADWLDSVGGSLEFKNSVGRGSFGKATGSDVTMKYGSRVEELSHEIGHVLDHKYGLYKYLTSGDDKDVIQSELSSLADLRIEGQDADPSYEDYIQTPEEQMANLMQAYLHAPDLAKKFAPTTLKKLNKFLGSKAELRPLKDIKPSLTTNVHEATYKVFGKVYVGRFVGPSEVAQVFNNYLSPGLAGSDVALLRSAYNGLRTANATLNAVQLGLSAFHGMTTALNMAFSQVALGLQQLTERQLKNGFLNVAVGATVFGSLFQNIVNGSKIKKAYLQGSSTDPDIQKAITMIAMAGGRIKPDAVYVNDFRRKLRTTWRDVMKDPAITLGGKAGRLGKLPYYAGQVMLEMASSLIMEHLVPWLKISAFQQLAANELIRLAKQKPNFTREDELATLSNAWDSIDNRFGQLIYDNLFMENTLKQALQQGFRAFGWTYGTVREIGGAAVDTGKQAVGASKYVANRIGGGGGSKPPGLGGSAGSAGPSGEPGPFTPKGVTIRQWYSLSMFVMTALIGGIITYLNTGEKPKDVKDLMYPRTGKKNYDGTDERLVLPTYAGETLKWMRNPLGTLANKKSGVIGAALDIKDNKTFGGMQVYDESEPWLKKFWHVLGFVGSQFVPISMQKNGEFDEHDWKQYLGVMKAPMSASRTPALEKAYQLIGDKAGSAAKTPDQALKSQAIKQYEKWWYDKNDAQKKGDQAQVDAYQKKLNDLDAKYPDTGKKAYKVMTTVTNDIPRIVPPIERAAKHLDNNGLIEVYKLCTPEEQPFVRNIIWQRMSNMRDKFYNHGGPVDKTWYDKAEKLTSAKNQALPEPDKEGTDSANAPDEP